MKPLVDILRSHEELIARSLTARLEHSDCCRLIETEPGSCTALLAALAAVAEAEGQSPAAADWAARLIREVGRLGLAYADVLAVLRRLERAVRVQVVKLTSNRKELLALLNQLSNAVDTLRRAYTEASFRPTVPAPESAERKQIEEALAESEARKRSIIESSLDPIITIDAEGLITEFNRAAELAFGRPRREVLGTKPSDVLFPTARQKQQDRIDRYLAVGEGSLLGRRSEIVAARAGGETFDAELAMTLSHERGQPVLTFFVRDISARKKAEADQARYRDELERSNRELERFGYVVSHDLQEPLRKIRVFGARLAAAGSGVDDAARGDLQRIGDAAERMDRLIEGLLRFSRVSVKARRFDSVDLAQIAAEVLSDLQARIDETAAHIDLGPLGRIEADPLQMRQLLQNLIGNALKFRSPDRPPLVRVCSEQVELESAPGQPPAPWCRITVQDNGIGFELSQAERIFGLFQRLHPRDAYEGTGVGLAICRKIAERHGGSIRALSKPGDGATFEVLLPVAQPDPIDHA